MPSNELRTLMKRLNDDISVDPNSRETNVRRAIKTKFSFYILKETKQKNCLKFEDLALCMTKLFSIV